MDDYFFGLDPVDFRHSEDHPSPRFVSQFFVYDKADYDSPGRLYVVSWSHTLTFERFLRIFCTENLTFHVVSVRVNCKLIRFNLDRYYLQLKSDFPNVVGSCFDMVKWSDLDDSGLIKFRKPKFSR